MIESSSIRKRRRSIAIDRSIDSPTLPIDSQTAASSTTSSQDLHILEKYPVLVQTVVPYLDLASLVHLRGARRGIRDLVDSHGPKVRIFSQPMRVLKLPIARSAHCKSPLLHASYHFHFPSLSTGTHTITKFYLC